MDGFQKINLDPIKTAKIETPKEEEPIRGGVMSKTKIFSKLKKLKNKKFLIPTGIILLVLLFLLFGIVLPTKASIAAAKKTATQARVAASAVKKQNILVADVELKKTREELQKTEKELKKMFFLGYIPFVNAYYNDANHLVNAGFYGLDAGDLFVGAVKPYADVLGLKGETPAEDIPTDKKIEIAIKTMDKVTPKIDDISKILTKVQGEIDEVDPGRYPNVLALKKVRTRLEEVKKIADEGAVFVSEAKPLIKVLPKLLGEPKEKKYLVLFQNDKELRATGGFLTAYAIFRVDKGLIHIDSTSDIYPLDDRISAKEKAPAPILKYFPNVSVLNLRDSNLSPDFIVSMDKFNELYAKARGPKVDGIIAVDTRALVAAMEILGDIQAGGRTFNTKINPVCDCPQVIYELEKSITQPVGYVRENRKSIIGDLLSALMVKALSASPKEYWGPLFQEMIKQTTEKHIMFYVYDKEGQKGIDALNASGRIRAFEGDYLHINETSFSGAKANLFVKNTVTHEYKVESDGSIIKTLTIDYKNPYPPSDCNLERGGLCLNANYRNWFRVFVPKGSELIDSQGSEVKIQTEPSYEPDSKLGKTVFEGFLTVRPKGAAKLVLTYKLPFKLESNSSLPFLIQKQPGIDGFEHTILNKGSELERFNLFTDKELILKLNRD